MEKDEWLEGIGVPRHLLARRVAQVPTTGTAGTHPAARHAPATPAPPPPDLIGIDITLPAPLEPSGQQQLTATGKFSDDSTQDLTKTVKWSADRDIVSIDAHGLAKAARGAAGKVKITATPASSNVSGQITVTIRLALQEIIVTPQNPLIEISQSRGLTATAVYADGEKEDITPKVDWQTSQPKVADFSGPGWCDGLAAGTAVVQALDAVSKMSGRTKVTVPAAGKAPKLTKLTIEPLNPDIKDGTPVQFTATGHYADGSSHEITDKVKWESSDPKTLTIDAKGVAKAGAGIIGQPLIRGSDPATNLYQSTTCYVETPGVRDVTLLPKALTLFVGDAAPLTVTAALFAGGEIKVNAHVNWTVADPQVAKVILNGEEVEGLAHGNTTIEALEPNSGKGDSIDVSVKPPVLRSIMVLGDARLTIGQTDTYTATGTFSDHNSKDLTDVTWSSSSPAIDIDHLGKATAKAAGKAVITAQDPTTHRYGSFEVTVAAPSATP